MELIDAYAEKANLSRHGAILDPIDRGLATDGAPTVTATMPLASEKTQRAKAAVEAKGLPILTANQQAEAIAERQRAEADRTRGWFNAKGKRS